MNPLLITGFGTSINVDKRKLIIKNRLKDTRLKFYPHRINHDGIIIDGHNGNITFEAMRRLCDISDTCSFAGHMIKCSKLWFESKKA